MARADSETSADSFISLRCTPPLQVARSIRALRSASDLNMASDRIWSKDGLRRPTQRRHKIIGVEIISPTG